MDLRTARPNLRNDERGMALAIALFAIVVIGALVAGTAYAGRLEMTGGRSAVYATQSQEQAETGLALAYANWNSAWNTLVATDPPQGPYVTTSPSGRERHSTTVTKLGGNIYYVESVGERLGVGGAVLSTRVLGQLGRLTTPELSIGAAVTANSEVTVQGTQTKVDGHNYNPPGWTGCPAPTGGVWGIQTSSTVRQNGNPDIQGVPGPMSVNDSTVYAGMWDDAFEALKSAKTFTLDTLAGVYHPQPTLNGAACNNIGNINNWGEPWRNPPALGAIMACAPYMPIIYWPGRAAGPSDGLKMTTGRGQGIIISESNIDIGGNFEFNGIILARGSVNSHGTGNKVTGAVISGNANIEDDDTFGGNPTILYSSCVIQEVLAGSSRGVPLAQKSWLQRW